MKGFEIRKKLELNFIKNYVEKNSLYFFFIKKYSVNTEKFKLCLRGELENMSDPTESHSISLIEKYQAILLSTKSTVSKHVCSVYPALL